MDLQERKEDLEAIELAMKELRRSARRYCFLRDLPHPAESELYKSRVQSLRDLSEVRERIETYRKFALASDIERAAL